MVLNKIRDAVNPILANIGGGFAKLGAPPWVWTLFGLVLSLISMSFYSHYNFAGGFFGGVFFLLSGFMDVVDGAVAKSTGTISKFGNFIDSTSDRLGEIMVYYGILIGNWASSDIVFLTVTFSLLVSYIRAKGDSLGVDLKGSGIGERAERMIILSVSSILGYTYYGVLLVSALAILTFMERSVITMNALRR